MVGAKYTRKDFCQLSPNEQISETTQYGDTFINERIFHWYTRSKRTLESAEVVNIIQSQRKEIDMHLFVQKDELEYPVNFDLYHYFVNR